MTKVSKKARAFVAKKIKKNIEEGRPPRQAIAIAFSQARAEGYYVGKRRPALKRKMKKMRKIS